MVLLITALEVSYDVKKAQYTSTTTITLELRVYTELQNYLVMYSVKGKLTAYVRYNNGIITLNCIILPCRCLLTPYRLQLKHD